MERRKEGSKEGREGGREGERKEEGKEGEKKKERNRRNSEIWAPNLLQGRLGNIIFLYAKEEETE